MFTPTHEDAAAAREMMDWALTRMGDRRRTLSPLTSAPALPALPAHGVGTKAAVPCRPQTRRFALGPE